MTIQQFSQNDPQWKGTPLGFDQTSTIGQYGCLLTAFTMVATHYGAASMTPGTLNDKMKAIGGFQAGTSFIIGGLLGTVVPGYSVDYHPAQGVPAPLADIDASLAADRPVIAELDWSPSPGLQTHYVVLYAKAGSDYLAYDPYPYPITGGQIKLSQSKYAQVAGSQDPAKIITAVFFTRGAGSSAPAAPKLDNGVYASFPVYATGDMQALRSQPILSDSTLLNRYAAGTAFKVLETDAAANGKIGQQNQWLAVQAPDGTQGYTAAWLVSKTQSTAVPASPAGSSTPAPAAPAAPQLDKGIYASFPVYATGDMQALRSQPVIADNTLLNRYAVGTPFKVLETDVSANSKIGQQNQWLAVKAPDGTQGYTAAWLVSKTGSGTGQPAAPASSPAATPAASPAAAGSAVVRTTADGVKLRSRPDFTDATVITSYPIGTELNALEPLADVQSKVGTVYQWLSVVDPQGKQGVVAAWYVSIVSPAP